MNTYKRLNTNENMLSNEWDDVKYKDTLNLNSYPILGPSFKKRMHTFDDHL